MKAELFFGMGFWRQPVFIAGKKTLTAHPPWQILFICILPQD
ncbi:hypothetical protein [Acetobacter lambici]|nr:hypothetical protein [Acetobacter lambici]